LKFPQTKGGRMTHFCIRSRRMRRKVEKLVLVKK